MKTVTSSLLVAALTLGSATALGQSAPDNQPAAPEAAASQPKKSFWDVDYARFHRLALTLGFGVGNADLDDVHTLANMVGAKTSSLQINAELSIRYYAPYYGLVHIGYSALYNWVDSQVDNHNLVMEVPIMLGGYYPFLGRLNAYAGIGPTIFFYRRSWWDPGVDFKTDNGVGMQLMAGGEIFLSEHFAFGLELRYRYLPGKALKEKNDYQVRGVDLNKYELSYSGFSVGVQFRFVAM